MVVRPHGVARRGAETGTQRGVVAQPEQRAGEGVRIPGGDDQAGALVLDQPAGGGADRVGRDHWDSLVEGFVGDQPHGSRKSRVGMDGMTTTSEPA